MQKQSNDDYLGCCEFDRLLAVSDQYVPHCSQATNAIDAHKQVLILQLHLPIRSKCEHHCLGGISRLCLLSKTKEARK